MASYQLASTCRPVFSRFVGSTLGPLNFTGLFMWFWMTGIIVGRIRWNRGRDLIQFNNEDGPEFWYRALGMLFPPNYMNNKISAHYIEINQIYAFEMFKRYRTVRKEMLEERSQCSDKEKRTKYITNPNYIYEPLGEDTTNVKSMFNQ